jgi:hypothetical protein
MRINHCGRGVVAIFGCAERAAISHPDRENLPPERGEDRIARRIALPVAGDLRQPVFGTRLRQSPKLTDVAVDEDDLPARAALHRPLKQSGRDSRANCSYRDRSAFPASRSIRATSSGASVVGITRVASVIVAFFRNF